MVFTIFLSALISAMYGFAAALITFFVYIFTDKNNPVSIHIPTHEESTHESAEATEN